MRAYKPDGYTVEFVEGRRGTPRRDIEPGRNARHGFRVCSEGESTEA